MVTLQPQMSNEDLTPSGCGPGKRGPSTGTVVVREFSHSRTVIRQGGNENTDLLLLLSAPATGRTQLEARD